MPEGEERERADEEEEEKKKRERKCDWALLKNVEECGEQVVSGDMKSSGDKCSRLVGRQQKSFQNEAAASGFTTSTPTLPPGGEREGG